MHPNVQESRQSQLAEWGAQIGLGKSELERNVEAVQEQRRTSLKINGVSEAAQTSTPTPPPPPIAAGSIGRRLRRSFTPPRHVLSTPGPRSRTPPVGQGRGERGVGITSKNTEAVDREEGEEASREVLTGRTGSIERDSEVAMAPDVETAAAAAAAEAQREMSVRAQRETEREAEREAEREVEREEAERMRAVAVATAETEPELFEEIESGIVAMAKAEHEEQGNFTPRSKVHLPCSI